MTDNFEKDIDVPSKEIIIDGMECRYWFRPNPTDYRKCSLRGQDDNCDEIKDCFIKELLGKLKAKEQEYEELKKTVNEAQNSGLDLKSFLVCEAVQNEYEQQLDQLKAELQKYKDMEAKGLEEFKDIGGCWGCGIQLALDQLRVDYDKLKQYKQSKQASYEALQEKCNELELENRKLKQTIAEIKEIAEDQKDVLESMRINKRGVR